LLLVLLVLIPSFALVLKGNFEQQRLKKERVRERVVATSKLAASAEGEYVNRARQILETLSQFPFLTLASNRLFCDVNFGNLRLLSPDFVDFGLIESTGKLFSSAALTNASPDLTSTSLFRKTSKSDDFTMGSLDGAIFTNAAITFGLPVESEDGSLRRIVYASLDQPLLTTVLSNISIPAGGAMTVFGPKGRILARYPSAKTWVGKNILADPFTRTALKIKNGTFEARGIDGTDRLYACSTVGNPEEPFFYVSIGLPLKLSFAEANRGLIENLASMVALALVLLAGAWLFAKKLLIEPINAVISASVKLANGDLSARTHISGTSEIHRLARNFDEMAESLARRNAELTNAHEEIMRMNADLERKVEARTSELLSANQELEAFSYSVSHDLRAPLRHMDGFANLLLDNDTIKNDSRALRFVTLITKSAKQMGVLIDELLDFSRMGRQAMRYETVDSNLLLKEVLEQTRVEQSNREIQWIVPDLPPVNGDAAMLTLVWTNLISNALKYSRGRSPAVIEVGAKMESDEIVFHVKDNGAGFDMKYADKLFGVFQRLHREEEFEGTGIGLANVRRIIHRHGGRTWAESEIGKGAVFYFSLPQKAS
jgi:signal transduction histidine kinase